MSTLNYDANGFIGSNKPIMLQSSNDTINQNLSDRGLAHAVTGGFGQDRYWG